MATVACALTVQTLWLGALKPVTLVSWNNDVHGEMVFYEIFRDTFSNKVMAQTK